MLTPRPLARGLNLVAAGPTTSRQRQPRWCDRRSPRYASDRNPTRSGPPRQKSAVGLRMASAPSLGCGRASRRARASCVSSASARGLQAVWCARWAWRRALRAPEWQRSESTLGALESFGEEERAEASVEALELEAMLQHEGFGEQVAAPQRLAPCGSTAVGKELGDEGGPSASGAAASRRRTRRRTRQAGEQTTLARAHLRCFDAALMFCRRISCSLKRDGSWCLPPGCVNVREW
ncbi:hypothetical protein AB1Y20_009636 [Prymnesium parvum]|uniref:Uncharacterized protein n=1 Tax=Prymnesium parvum TaxID=97485 RepID=A0AB34K743_PRYPA